MLSAVARATEFSSLARLALRLSHFALISIAFAPLGFIGQLASLRVY